MSGTESGNNTITGSQHSLKPLNGGGNSSPPKLAATTSQSSHISHGNNVPTIPFNRILSPVEYLNLRFLILDCPTDTTLPLYLQEMKQRNVTDVVRVCEPTYSKSLLEENDIKVHDWPFKDGGIPSNEIILNFLSLCDERFGGLASQHTIPSATNAQQAKSQIQKTNNNPCIAVHCVAGLGRAPILVAITLIESGMTPIDSVEYVRQRRRGALNTVQLQFLMDSYKRQWAKKSSKMGFFSGKRSGSPPYEAKELNGHSSSSGFGGFKESLTKVFKFNRKSSTVSTAD